MSTNTLILAKDEKNNSKFVRCNNEGKLLLDTTGISFVVDISGQTVNIGTMPSVDVNGFSSITDFLTTGGMSVVLSDLDENQITNTVIDTKRGLDVNVINTSSDYATETTLSAIDTKLGEELSVNVISGFATETTLAAIDTKLGEELSVNVISGFATETTLAAIDTKLGEELSVNVISGFATETTLAAIDTKLGEELSVNVISGFATETTLAAIDTKLGEELSVNVISGFATETTLAAIDTKLGEELSVNVISGFATETTLAEIDTKLETGVNVNILDTNSTIYDLTNDAPTMTENDTRFTADRVRSDSWAFDTSKSTLGSNVYWYSNSSTSPLGVQQFPILHGDINSLYCVVSINKTENNNRLPFLALFSPSGSAFYTSRWIYTIDPNEKIIQTEKVLLYWNNDPVDIYTNLRHIQLLKNVIASEGPQLESETIFLMSVNTASGEPSNSISYNLYNAGFILDSVHNDYEFNSGIKSKADLLLSKLSVSDSTNLNVNVSNALGVTVSNTVDVANSNLDSFTFDIIDGKPTKGLNVITRNTYLANITQYQLADISGNDLPSMDLRAFKTLSIFGNRTHTGPGSHNIIVQFSIDGITFYDSPYVISVNGSDNFAWDFKDFCVPYLRLRFQVQVTALTLFLCLK